MAQFYSPKSSKSTSRPSSKPAQRQVLQIQVDGLSSEAAGVGRLGAEHRGKPVFIPGALPGERVRIQITEEKRKLAQGKLLGIEQASAERVEPFCPHYAQCGGCQLQHLATEAQRKYKQQRLANLLSRQAGLTPDEWAEPITGADTRYRRRARLAVQWQGRQPVIGFRQKNSDKAADIAHCPVLAEPLGDVFSWLRPLLASLFKGPHVTHAEVVQAQQPILLLRHTRPLPPADIGKLQTECGRQGWWLYLKGPDERLVCTHEQHPVYRLEELELVFEPQDFIQVNPEVNQRMVAQALDWLELAPEHKVLDLFCGLGNFSLPLAQRVSQVVGVEGVESMVSRACDNAARNNLTNAEFYCADLSQGLTEQPWAQAQRFDRVLLDPARAGAKGLVEHLGQLDAERIVYVSCDPATLARDAAELAKQGYHLQRAGVLDMFPHTFHLESMALFVRSTQR